MTHQVRPYDFVGEERVVVDAERFDRALRAWSDYLIPHLSEQGSHRRPGTSGHQP